MDLKKGKGIPLEMAIAVGILAAMLIVIGAPYLCSLTESLIGHVGFCSFWVFLHNILGGHSSAR